MISKRARYALHVVAYLAYKKADVPVTLIEIRTYLKSYSGTQRPSVSYLTSVLHDLARAGVVQAHSGRKGGYLLARPASEVSLVDIVKILDGVPGEQSCVLSVGCCRNMESCGVFRILQKAQDRFFDCLAAETADSVAQKMFQERPPEFAV